MFVFFFLSMKISAFERADAEEVRTHRGAGLDLALLLELLPVLMPPCTRLAHEQGLKASRRRDRRVQVLH